MSDLSSERSDRGALTVNHKKPCQNSPQILLNLYLTNMKLLQAEKKTGYGKQQFTLRKNHANWTHQQTLQSNTCIYSLHIASHQKHGQKHGIKPTPRHHAASDRCCNANLHVSYVHSNCIKKYFKDLIHIECTVKAKHIDSMNSFAAQKKQQTIHRHPPSTIHSRQGTKYIWG